MTVAILLLYEKDIGLASYVLHMYTYVHACKLIASILLYNFYLRLALVQHSSSKVISN